MNRNVAAGTLVALLVVTSGCMGALSGPLTFSASQATVNDATLADTGYETNRTEEMTVKQEFSAAGQTKEVEVTNWISEYHKSVGIDGVAKKPVAAFVVFSSPQVDVLGKSFNPLDKYSNRELAETFTQRMERVKDVRKVSSRNETMLGKTTEVTKFEATVTTSVGIQFDAYVHVTKVKHDGDVVVALAVYPKQLPDHQQTVNQLIRGIEHGE